MVTAIACDIFQETGPLRIIGITEFWTSPLQGKDFLQVCEYLRQLHAMPLLHLMRSTNPKMDWCNILHFNYGHNATFNFDYVALHL